MIADIDPSRNIRVFLDTKETETIASAKIKGRLVDKTDPSLVQFLELRADPAVIVRAPHITHPTYAIWAPFDGGYDFRIAEELRSDMKYFGSIGFPYDRQNNFKMHLYDTDRLNTMLHEELKMLKEYEL